MLYKHANKINYYLLSRSIHTICNFRSALSELFENQHFIMKLSEQTRIYPDYFQNKYIKDMLNSEKIQEYRNYVDTKYYMPAQLAKNTHTKLLNSQHPHLSQVLPYLDCYVDWLFNNKLIKNSDEYYKNKCTMEIFDMRSPQNWFNVQKDRHFIYHHGPTNSGKTSSAIKQLKQLPKDKKGIYMAPLRLLAWEMQQKLGNCNLITGQDKQYKVSNLTSCTIEAMSISSEYDVAIIDQIQMIGDNERGWSWTKAILATNAKRIHLCGDQRALGIVSQLIKQSGGTLQERRYSRLGKLKLIHKKYQIEDIAEGDCLIEFSVQTLHRLRLKIKDIVNQRQTDRIPCNNLISKKQYQNDDKNISITQNHYDLQNPKKISKIAMVYGRLPPECRKQEARKFNQRIAPYLVATNAIGMGLNLNIKKIIFAGIKRRNTQRMQVELEEHQIQQIAGRAGRGLNDGFVQCASYEIFKKVRKALKNVNKTYGINLQDQQSIEDPKKATDDDDNQVIAKQIKQQFNYKHYDHFLKRVLTEKQRTIQKAGLFLQYTFMKRTSAFLQQHYQKKVKLLKSLKFYINLALKQQEFYFLSQKPGLLLWMKDLQNNFVFQRSDQFQIAKALSMNYGSSFVKKKMRSFAQEFQNNQVVNLSKNMLNNNKIQKFNQNYQQLQILQENYSILQVYINLWNKYEFMFQNIQLAKKLKQQTSKLIKQVLQDQNGFKLGSEKIKKYHRQTNKVPKITEQSQLMSQKGVLLDEQANTIQNLK